MLNLAHLKVGWDQVQDLAPGDLVSVRTPESVISQIIRGLSQREGEPPTFASHSGVLEENPHLVIEALAVVTRRPLSAYAGKSQVAVMRCPYVTIGNGLRIAAAAGARLGQKYGWWKLLQHAHGRASRILRNDRPICSQLVAECYEDVTHRGFGVPANTAQPDDLLDFAVYNNWPLVWVDSPATLADLVGIYDGETAALADEMMARHGIDPQARANAPTQFHPRPADRPPSVSAEGRTAGIDADPFPRVPARGFPAANHGPGKLSPEPKAESRKQRAEGRSPISDFRFPNFRFSPA